MSRRRWSRSLRNCPASRKSGSAGRRPETVLADKVHDSAGQNLDGNKDGTAHDDAIENLYRFFGDTDGDRDVDNSDFFYFRKAYFGQIPYVSFLDFDGDGQYTQADLHAFLARHNKKPLA